MRVNSTAIAVGVGVAMCEMGRVKVTVKSSNSRHSSKSNIMSSRGSDRYRESNGISNRKSDSNTEGSSNNKGDRKSISDRGGITLHTK